MRLLKNNYAFIDGQNLLRKKLEYKRKEPHEDKTS